MWDLFSELDKIQNIVDKSRSKPKNQQFVKDLILFQKEIPSDEIFRQNFLIFMNFLMSLIKRK